MFDLIVLGIMFLVLMILLCVPLIIANIRGIYGPWRITIMVLTFFGVLMGVTWLIALILSLGLRVDLAYDDLANLERLNQLYKQKVISRAEFQELKSRMLNHE